MVEVTLANVEATLTAGLRGEVGELIQPHTVQIRGVVLSDIPLSRTMQCEACAVCPNKPRSDNGYPCTLFRISGDPRKLNIGGQVSLNKGPNAYNFSVRAHGPCSTPECVIGGKKDLTPAEYVQGWIPPGKVIRDDGTVRSQTVLLSIADIEEEMAG